jgi:hypothetical protein
MSNETTSSTLSELYTEIVAEAQFVAQEQSIMRNLVKNYTITGGGKAVEVPIYSAVSASAVNEATDLSNTAIDPTSVTITASEIGIMTTLTDLARNSAPRNVAADIGRLYDLKANLTNTFANPNGGELQNEAMRSGYVGSLAGLRIFETSNISNSGNVGDYIGAAMHKDALAIAMMQDVKIETQRDASLRADEIVATSIYGVGEIHDTYGVQLSFDSSIQ